MTITALTTFFVFVLGAIVGSFLNVVILRYNTGAGITGRSRCFTCRKIIRWFENIPILSFAMLRGRCSTCKAALSVQYPAIELITALVFTAVAWKTLFVPGIDVYSLLSTLYFLLIMSIFIVIAVYDLRHTIIPNALVYTAAGLALAGLIVSGARNGTDLMFWFDLAAGPILFIPFWAMWYFSGGTWMGFGDAKLALAIGWLLGLAQGVSAVVWGFWIGAAYAVIAMIVQRLGGSKGLTMKSRVPFGPFLIIGTLVAFLFGVDVFEIETLVWYLIR